MVPSRPPQPFLVPPLGGPLSLRRLPLPHPSPPSPSVLSPAPPPTRVGRLFFPFLGAARHFPPV